MNDAFHAAQSRVLAEWDLVKLHVPMEVAALIFPIRVIWLLPTLEGPKFDGRGGSISVSRDYLGEPSNPTSSAVVVSVHADSMWTAAYADLALVAESGERPPAGVAEPAVADVIPGELERFARDWEEAKRHVPSEVLGSLGEIERLMIGEDDSLQIHCVDGFVVIEREYLDEPNPLGSTTVVQVLGYPRQAVELGVRYTAIYSDQELVQ